LRSGFRRPGQGKPKVPSAIRPHEHQQITHRLETLRLRPWTDEVGIADGSSTFCPY
jgi:hypothetical protein